MGDITLQKAIQEYEIIYLASRNLSVRTRVEYLNDIIDLIRFLEVAGIKQVNELRLPQLEHYLASLDQRGIAGSTRKRKVVSIRSFLWYLYQDQYLKNNLSKRIIPPYAETKTPRYLTKIEIQRLLVVSLNKIRDYALIRLLLQTGIKLSECNRLTTDDIELPENLYSAEVEGFIHIERGKGRKSRIMPLDNVTCKALDRYLKTKPSTSSFLFVNRFGAPLSARGIEKILTRYYAKANIKNATVQSLRHTFGVTHAMRGADMKTIQAEMGLQDSRSLAPYLSLVHQMRLVE